MCKKKHKEYLNEKQLRNFGNFVICKIVEVYFLNYKHFNFAIETKRNYDISSMIYHIYDTNVNSHCMEHYGQQLQYKIFAC